MWVLMSWFDTLIIIIIRDDPLLYKILVKGNNPGISPDIKDFKFRAIIISVWYLHFR